MAATPHCGRSRTIRRKSPRLQRSRLSLPLRRRLLLQLHQWSRKRLPNPHPPRQRKVAQKQQRNRSRVAVLLPIPAIIRSRATLPAERHAVALATIPTRVIRHLVLLAACQVPPDQLPAPCRLVRGLTQARCALPNGVAVDPAVQADDRAVVLVVAAVVPVVAAAVATTAVVQVAPREAALVRPGVVLVRAAQVVGRVVGLADLVVVDQAAKAELASPSARSVRNSTIWKLPPLVG